MADKAWEKLDTNARAVDAFTVSIDSTDNDSQVLGLNPNKETVVTFKPASGDTLTVQATVRPDRTNLIAVTDAAGTALSVTANRTVKLPKGYTGLKVLGANQVTASVVDATMVLA